MAVENFRALAGLIASHPEGKVVGRTRLQKEVKLLQRLGFPTDYSYTIHFYGPYSESLQSDIGLLEASGLIEEHASISQEGNPYYVLRARSVDVDPAVESFKERIAMLNATSPVVLELAATYDAFRESGSEHDDAMQRLRRKKAAKCSQENEARAFELLRALGLQTE